MSLVYELCKHFKLFYIAYAVADTGLRVGAGFVERLHGDAVFINGSFRGITGVCLHWVLTADTVDTVGIGVKHPLAPSRAAVGRDPCVEQLKKITACDISNGLFGFGRAHRGA